MRDMTDLSATNQTFDGPIPGIPGAMVQQVSGLAEHLDGGRLIGPRTEATNNALLFDLPNIARYLVRDGSRIEVEPAPGADPRAVSLFLNGSARGALIHQRGELALNAATLIAPNWACVALCSPSGIGKSTLAAELTRRGWLLLSDDITRVTWNGSAAVAWPGNSEIKLWRDACERFGYDCSQLVRVREGLEKYFLPAKPSATPAALSLVVRLRIAPSSGVLHVPPPQVKEVLAECTFKPRMLEAFGRRHDHAMLVERIGGVCRAIVLDGARERPITEIADRLSELLR
ncbi:MAG: hypothetical protein ABSD74_10725 [Rhizomicrobium sp.]|jgi:hypothetical protein